MLTVFTPTYNRANTLPRLFSSLKEQTNKDFEWLIIDDGSSDETESMIQKWSVQNNGFTIRYLKVENGGKQRAINKALSLALGDYFFIVDSDDALLPFAVSFILDAFSSLPDDESFIGISGLRGDLDGTPLGGNPRMEGNPWVDATNLDRSKYGLAADMAEAFFTRKLKHYPFPVWDGEKFTPEAVIWDRMALDGYKLRWFDKVIYLCDYQKGGLMDSSWKLLKDNPMGFTMLFKIKTEYENSLIKKAWLYIQAISCCCLGGEYGYISKIASPLACILLFPIGYCLSLRRRRQFSKYL